MKFGYTIVYVDSVPNALRFYEKAFGFQTRFLHGSSQYGELETGATILAFASHEMGELNLQGRYLRGDAESEPLGIELAFVVEDVASAFQNAIDAGAKPIAESTTKPWGQIVAYVRAAEGTLVSYARQSVHNKSLNRSGGWARVLNVKVAGRSPVMQVHPSLTIDFTAIIGYTSDIQH